MSDQESYLRYDDDDDLQKKEYKSFYQDIDQQRLKVSITQQPKSSQLQPFYDKDTFDFSQMFICVDAHRNYISPSRFDDTSLQNLHSFSRPMIYGNKDNSQVNISQQNSNSFNGVSGLSSSSWSRTKKSKGNDDHNEQSSQVLNVLDQLQKQSGSEGQQQPTHNNKFDQDQKKQIKQQPSQSLQNNKQTKQRQQQQEENQQAKQLDVMELNLSGIQQNEDFQKIMNTSFSNQLHLNSLDNKQETPASEEDSQEKQLFKQKRLNQLEKCSMQRLIIRFKYQNCAKISMKCITHQLSSKNVKPKKIQANQYLVINSTKFKTNRPNSDNQLWEIGKSKIPIQILCVTMSCNYCGTGMNIAYSRTGFFSTICRNQLCMKPMSFEVTEVSPK